MNQRRCKSFRVRFNRKWPRWHQGAGECARRRRQIEKGQLTAANGLLVPNA